MCGIGPFPESMILAHIMAYELGHLLLGEDSHAATGIMIKNLRKENLLRGRHLC